ncbi:unnamed protein product [Thlaspi arvense]|uniref:Uncharacterized protein n=1 Tax=Thlaspi arvense TaxID=13288 RepID=A0AAU9RLC9_THLAR|nr:unnamed protein product [Thlaspi arvense]
MTQDFSSFCKMKFGKDFSLQMVQEWHESYMNYSSLKSQLKDIKFKRINNPPRHGRHHGEGLRQKRTLHGHHHGEGLLSTPGPRSHHHGGHRHRHGHGGGQIGHFSDSDDDIEEGLKPAPIVVQSTIHGNRTTFLMVAEQGGGYEMEFFRRLDDEFNKVEKFYKDKVKEVKEKYIKLNSQMELLIAFRQKVKVPNGCREMTPLASASAGASFNMRAGAKSHMEAIQEGGSSKTGKSEEDDDDIVVSDVVAGDISRLKAARPSPIEVKWDRVTINLTNDTPRSTIKGVLKLSNTESEYTRDNLRKVEEQLKRAFVEFYQELELLKSYRGRNVDAFSKILKKYDKITSRHARECYMKIVNTSYLGRSDKVIRRMERVEATFIKHFTNDNRSKGMKILRREPKRERHRITFSTGFLGGCMFSLVVALFAIIRTRNILHKKGQEQYMNTMFPLYSLFGFIVLHILIYAGNIYYWRRYQVNYPSILEFKQGTELSYRQVLFVGFSIGVCALLCVIANLDMEVDPETKDYKALTELLPLFLLIVLFIVLILPFNTFYRSHRVFFLTCLFHCIAAPLYKVQAFRSVPFYICHYGWGDYKHRINTCKDSEPHKAFLFIVAVVPYTWRLLQCLRRLFEEKNTEQGYNGLKHFLTIVAVCLRTAYSVVDKDHQFVWRMLAGIFSAIAAIFGTYWDLVHDWGLLNRTSKNRWLRDKLLVPQKNVYFIAMILNILLRFAWLQTVLDFHFNFMHRETMIAVVASLEIIRRGIWNFFRLENEHLNNVKTGKAVKTVSLPFDYDEDDDKGKIS